MHAVDRRTLLTGTAATLLGTRMARADGACPGGSFYQPLGQAICDAFVAPKGLQIASQSDSEWCWAASTSNVFAYHGYSVSQETIVNSGIGRIANEPGSLPVINSVLNKSWVDSSGKKFSTNSNILFSVDLGIPMISNAALISILQANRPLLFCNMQHAMMLISLNYVPPATRAGNVVAMIVVDPWPGMGLRSLTQAEMIPANLGGQARLVVEVEVT